MGNRVVKLLLYLSLFIVIAIASEIESEIDKYNKQIDYSSRNDAIAILHHLKNLYINTIIEGDERLQAKTLKGMIKCSKILKLDYKKYEKELKTLTKTTTLKPKKILSIKDIVPIKKQSSKLISSINKIEIINNALILNLDKTLTKKDITYFQLNTKDSYKNIYDIKANNNILIPSLKIDGVDKIRVAQYRKDKFRVVLENSSKINSFFELQNKRVIIHFIQNKITKKSKIKKSHKVTKNHKIKKRKKLYASSKIIVIDPGHGGKDTGAVGYKKIKEKDIVLKISKYLYDFLKKKGYRVYLSRDRDKFIKLRERTKYANNKNADLFISIHANAAPGKTLFSSMKGIEVFFLSPAKTARAKRVAEKENITSIINMNSISKDTFLSLLNHQKIVQSNKLAIDIQKGILSNLKSKYQNVIDGGVRKAPFWVLIGAQMPAILIETGYITNPNEASKLKNPYYQRRLAKGIANGIDNYFINNY